MDQFEVILCERINGNRRSLMFKAETFAHAEEQAEPYIDHNWEIIITIVRDWSPDA